MDALNFKITDSVSGEVKPFSIANFRANIFDILEEEYGTVEANKILGHSGGDASKDIGLLHYKPLRLRTRKGLQKGSVIDQFAVIFLEDILAKVDPKTKDVALPIGNGMNPKTFLQGQGFNKAALTVGEFKPPTPVDRVLDGAANAVSMTQNQIAQLTNTIRETFGVLSEALDTQLGQLRTKLGQVSKTAEEVKEATLARKGEKSKSLQDKIDNMPEIDRSDLRSLDVMNKRRLLKGLVTGLVTTAVAAPVKAAEGFVDIALESTDLAPEIQTRDKVDIEEERLLKLMQSDVMTPDLEFERDLAAKELRDCVSTKEKMLKRKSHPYRKSIDEKIRSYVERYKGELQDYAAEDDEREALYFDQRKGFAIPQN